MALELGGVVARVIWDDAALIKGLARGMASMKEFAAQATAAATGSGDLDASLSSVGASATKASAGLGRATKASTDNAAAQTKAAAAAERQAEAQANVAATMARYSSASAKVQANALRQVAAQQRLAASAAEAGSAEEKLAAETATLASRQATAIASSARLAASQVSLGDKLTTAGARISHAITLPVIAAAAVSVDQAAKYQKSMTLIQTAAGETAQKTKAISSGLFVDAKQTGTSLSDLSEGIYTVAKAGAQKWSAAGQLTIVKAAAQGAKAEMVPLGTSVSALTSVMQGYGLSANQAVEAENQIIRASGLSKTSMQQFAGSLSNVIPLASALHISFAQIGGAIATMTQHGESPERATENLNNLIRNLAGSNTVAVKAMGQLGVKSQDVAKVLSKQGPGGGLAGALDMVEAAMAKNSHGGDIVISAFKQAQNATHDLSTELAHMPPNLQAISKQFASGKLGYQDYYSDVKSLGGATFEMGKQFISTMSTAKGFSDALKSGNPQVQTAAQAFKTLLGGATGMNAALMLSGKSAATFKSATSEIAQAAQHSGSDVLGWSKTSQTFSVKLDQAKESLQVLAVEAGTELLPTLTKIAADGEKAFNWVGGLDHSQKEILGWSIGVLAAMGPVLSIGGRLATVGSGIGTFVTGASARLASLAGASEASATTVSLSMGRITAGLAGAGIGVAAGELTKNSSTATKAIGALTAAGAGAAIGFGVGGPLGAAIGGIGAGVGDLAVQWIHSGDAAKSGSAKAQVAAAAAARATAAEKQAVQGLLQQLEAVGGQYGKNYRLAVINSTPGQSLLKAGQSLGLNAHTVTSAALGNTKAEAAIMGQLYKQSPILNTQMAKFAQSLDKVTGETGGAEKAYELYLQAQGKGVVSEKQLAGGLANLTKELDHHGTALTTDADKTIASSGFAARNTAVITENIKAINSNAASQIAHGHSVADVATKYQTQVANLQNSTGKLGFNKQAVDALVTSEGKLPAKVVTYLQKQGVLPADIQAIVDKYAKIPTSKVTGIGVLNHATPTIDQIHAALAALHDKTITVTTRQSEINQYRSFNPPGHAKGGNVADGFFTMGERGWELGYKKGSELQILSHPHSMAATGMPNVLPGFANGTVPATGESGTELVHRGGGVRI